MCCEFADALVKCGVVSAQASDCMVGVVGFQIASVEMQNVERIVDDRVSGLVVECLKRRAAVLVERDNLPVDESAVRTDLRHAASD